MITMRSSTCFCLRILSFATLNLLAAFLTAAASQAAPSSPGTQPAPARPTTGLLPPVMVLFEDRNNRPVPNAEWSSQAADAMSSAFIAEMADKQVRLVPVGREDAGPPDPSPLYGLPERMAQGDHQPLPEALLSSPYPPASMTSVMERHQLDALWVVSGVQVPPRGGAQPGKRFVLRAALMDRKGTVRFSDMVRDDGAGDLRDLEAARRAVRKLLAEYRTEERKAEAAQAAVIAAEVQAAEPKSPHPAELRIGFGIFFVAPDGVDLLVSFSPANSRWQLGYRYVRWTDTFNDPFTGRELTETTETMQGPQVNYLFRPEQNSTWYLGVSVLRWSRTEVHLVTGASDSDSVTSPFFGGGYTGHIGKHVFYNLGMFLTAADLKTDTGASSDESSGGFDIQLQLGVVF